MDVAIVLLLPLLGGYYFSKRSIVTRYKTPRESGHHLYFKSAIIGVWLFIIIGLLHCIIYFSLPTYFNLFQTFIIKTKTLFDDRSIISHIFWVAILCFLGSFFLWRPFNLFAAKYAECDDLSKKDSLGTSSDIPHYLRKAISDDDIAYVLTSAAIRKMAVLATTDSGKVYVGYVTNTPDPSVERKSFTLLPVMSGFRNEEHKICFNTDYDFVHSDMKDETISDLPHLVKDDFIVTLPIDKISSLRFFDFAAYEKFSNMDG